MVLQAFRDPVSDAILTQSLIRLRLSVSPLSASLMVETKLVVEKSVILLSRPSKNLTLPNEHRVEAEFSVWCRLTSW